MTHGAERLYMDVASESGVIMVGMNTGEGKNIITTEKIYNERSYYARNY
jgi:hypothetical protein